MHPNSGSDTGQNGSNDCSIQYIYIQNQICQICKLNEYQRFIGYSELTQTCDSVSYPETRRWTNAFTYCETGRLSQLQPMSRQVETLTWNLQFYICSSRMHLFSVPSSVPWVSSFRTSSWYVHVQLDMNLDSSAAQSAYRRLHAYLKSTTMTKSGTKTGQKRK